MFSTDVDKLEHSKKYNKKYYDLLVDHVLKKMVLCHVLTIFLMTYKGLEIILRPLTLCGFGVVEPKNKQYKF